MQELAHICALLDREVEQESSFSYFRSVYNIPHFTVLMVVDSFKQKQRAMVLVTQREHVWNHFYDIRMHLHNIMAIYPFKDSFLRCLAVPCSHAQGQMD